jgi:predicted Zn-dependent peptidase
MAAVLLAGAAAQGAPLDVVEIRPPGGPRVAIHEDRSPLVTVRLSAPVPPDAPEGGPELLQELARPGATEAVARFGGRVMFRHDGGHAVVTVTAPATAFDPVVAVVRRVAGEPDLATSALRAARSRGEDRVLAALERPATRVRLALWRALYGGPPPSAPAVHTLDREAIRGLRRRIYDPARMRAVVVGPVPVEAIRSAFARWDVETEAPHPPTAEDRDPVEAPPPEPEVHFRWAGLGFRTGAEPAAVAVAASLVESRIAGSALRSGLAEAWDGPGGTALVVLGTAVPDDPVVRATAEVGQVRLREEGLAGRALPPGDIAGYLRRLIAEAAAVSSRDDVAFAARRLRGRLLVEAGTSEGRAEIIGRLADATGRAEAAAHLLQRLGTLEADEVRGAVADILDSPAVLIDVRPPSDGSSR